MIELGYTESDRVILHDQPEYTASIHVASFDEGREMTFFHLDVYYLSASILKGMLSRWREWRQEHPQWLFTMADADTPALDRLREKFGFRYVSDVLCTDNKTRKLFVHYGPQAQ